MPEPPAVPSRAEDDTTIADDDYVYRRIHPTHLHEEEGVVRPRSGAFEDKDDGISVFIHSEIAALGLVPRDILENYPGRLVARLRVGGIRSLVLRDGTAARCGVTRDPNPEGAPNHPCDPAHGLVHIPPDGKARARKTWKALAELAEIVLGLSES